ncbi:imelysin family protein [Crocinitomix catalasitica]|uniref:imelysin family protein n=1 Tax=Crocinitomix catalasitica TaxID=184607 RepID=UPI00048608B7|nr:imelysin family protein [Crocinitomix catalasitica]
MKISRIIFILSAVLLLAACKKKKINTLESEFKETYASIVYANYQDAYTKTVELQTALTTFVSAPSDANLTAAKNAWLAAREPYGQSEAFRFSGGPIDDADGPEGALNAWPLDEGYVDYIEGADASGIINDTDIIITKELLISLNEEGGEKNISIGYHAIEFLLWGQDDANTALKTPGNRPYTDYITDGTGTAENQARRGQYLLACADILVDDLNSMVNEWKESGAYRTAFMAEDDDVSMGNILTGMGVLGKSELAGERIFTALDNQDQEDEHSCFSDNTHRDIITNFKGIQNIYNGSYTSTTGATTSGTSLSDILEKSDKKLNEELQELFATCNTNVNAIPVPFDFALTQETPGGSGPINTTVTNLRALGDKIAEAGSSLDLTINTALPE